MKTENLAYNIHYHSYLFKNNNNKNANKTTAGVNPSGRLSFKAAPPVTAIKKTFGERLAVNKVFNKFLDILADNSLIADALIALGLTAIARPASIYIIPTKDPKEKKKNNYQVAHSIATGLLGLATTIVVAEPIKRGVAKLMANPKKYMKNDFSYINNNPRVFKETAGRLHQPIFLPLRAALTIMIVKPILDMMGLSKETSVSPKDKVRIDNSFMSFKGLKDKKAFARFANLGSASDKVNNKNIAFKGAGSMVTEGIAKGVGKIADTNKFRKFIEWFKKKDQWFPHLVAAESLWLSGFYMQQTAKSKQIEKDQKLPMILNQGITALLCTWCAYKVDGKIKNRLEKYKEVYKRMNPQLEESLMEKRLTGIKLLGPIVIFTTIYRFVGPVVVTPIANKISELIEHKNKKAA